jgi:Arc/MetJ family transcription regulator
MSRTTLDIDERLLTAAMEATGLKTKAQVVEHALRTLVRQHAQRQLSAELGSYDLDLDQAMLDHLRADG